MSKDTDYLVIGAGSAGNVITRRLLDAGHTVTLVEAGDSEDVNPNIDRLDELGLIWHSEQDWDYFSVPQAGASHRKIHLPRGKVTGGSHALNACIWVRGQAWDYEQWEAAGCPGWGWDDVLPWFKRIENFDGGASDVHGDSGLLDVREDYERNPLQEDLFAAAVAAGHPVEKDYNDGHAEGVARMQLNLRDGKRFNTWRAYLRDVQDHPDLTLITGGRVLRLLLSDGHVDGVVYRGADGDVELRAGETILCAGAIGSPEILLRSGVGPAEELRQVGITPVHDLPGVGRNLHDHFLSPVIYSAEREIPACPVSATEVHLFSKSSPERAVPDLQPLFFSVPMYTEGYGPDGAGTMSGPANAFTLHAGLVRPDSRGTLTLTGPDPEDPIAVDVACLAEQSDVDRLVVSVREMREIGRQPELADWGPREIWPGEDVADEDLEQYVRDSVVTYHHQVGTCRMGRDADAVVDPETFAVHGLSGLRIADASLMPQVTSGNTNAPTVMIAERAAAHLTA